MQVNFVHNYSKTFFKGCSHSSGTKAVSNKPITARKFRSPARQQARHYRAAAAEALHYSPSTEIYEYKVPVPTVKTAGHGVYNGSGTNKISYKDIYEELRLNQGDIVEIINYGNKTTYMMRDGGVIKVDEEARKTTFDYSKCLGRDENAPIKQIIRRVRGCDLNMLEEYWKNGTYECFDDDGKLRGTTRMKRNGCHISFWSDNPGNFYVSDETFPPKPEGEKTRYSEYCTIDPHRVSYDKNNNLKKIRYYDYEEILNQRLIKLDSWDGIANKIQSYSYPLHEIEFYPTGKIKSEHYTFEVYGSRRDFEIKFNKNGQVDNVIITNGYNDDVIEKETSSQIKKELIEANYKGYTECASDLQERAEIAYSVLKRFKETPQ